MKVRSKMTVWALLLAAAITTAGRTVNAQNPVPVPPPQAVPPPPPPLPTVQGGSDAFLTKITPTGSVVYSSYMGGSRQDRAKGIALDPSGNVYLTGSTHFNSPLSSSFFDIQPLQTCSQQNGFVIKLNTTYVREYATCLGGTSVLGDEGHAG